MRVITTNICLERILRAYKLPPPRELKIGSVSRAPPRSGKIMFEASVDTLIGNYVSFSREMRNSDK
jgi:hypothetical protein